MRVGRADARALQPRRVVLLPDHLLVLHVGCSFLHHLLLHHVGLHGGGVVVGIVAHHHVVIIGAVGQRSTNSLTHGLVHLIHAMLVCWVGHTADYVAASYHFYVLLIGPILILMVACRPQVLVKDYFTIRLV